MQDGGIGSDTLSLQGNLQTRSRAPIGVCFRRGNSPPDAKAWDRPHRFPWRLILVLRKVSRVTQNSF